MSTVVIVDDEADVREANAQSLLLADLPTRAFERASLALEVIGRSFDGVIVSDIRMPEIDGLEFMRRVQAVDPEIPVILITGHGDVAMAVQAMRDGAYDFLEKPFRPDVLINSVRRALDKRALTIENRALREQANASAPLEQFLLGQSGAMRRLRDQVSALAPTDADVLIYGETGAGKEVVARALHELSPRGRGRFVPINCAALPESLIESELFGHEAGAFTGAQKRRIGKFEHADGGTVFLDEIEGMPLETQAHMLRTLQERSITRLGSNTPIPINVRVIAATKRDLKRAADQGEFREDLFYRLNVLQLAIPPLRERPQDIPLLFRHFADEAARRFRVTAPEMSAELTAHVLSAEWPGNVRELQNAATRFALGQFPMPGEHSDTSATSDGAPAGWLSAQMAAFERELLERALTDHGGSMKKTYEALGISRKTLYDKLRRYGIEPPGRD